MVRRATAGSFGRCPERATHLPLLYTGEDVYHFLVGTYRWSHEDWVDWTVAALLHEVFGLTSSGRDG